MLGTILLSATHRGTIFSSNNSTYALLNGQLLSRNSYPSISAYWPTGAYGSTSTTMVLPDLSTGYHLRGHSFQNGVDSGFASRTVPSGILPAAPSGIGTFQTANMVSHTHPSGTQGTANGDGNGGGDSNPTWPNFGPGTSAEASGFTVATAIGAASVTSFDVAHMKFYPYIKIA